VRPKGKIMSNRKHDDREPKRAALRPQIPHDPAPAFLDIRLPPDKTATKRSENRCPRCRSKLSERFDFGWCQRCGYCRYFQERSPVAEEVNAGNDPQVARVDVPQRWVGVLLCGWLVCAVSSYLAVQNVKHDAEARYIWCVAQVSVGLAMMAAAHWSAFLTIVPRGLRGRHAALFVSPWLWWAVCRRVPETRAAIWLLAWGASIVTGAGVIYALFEGITPAMLHLPF
jgi:DNA-directed RNA polymerase subunit RPC12/RpoP